MHDLFAIGYYPVLLSAYVLYTGDHLFLNSLFDGMSYCVQSYDNQHLVFDVYCLKGFIRVELVYPFHAMYRAVGLAKSGSTLLPLIFSCARGSLEQKRNNIMRGAIDSYFVSAILGLEE